MHSSFRRIESCIDDQGNVHLSKFNIFTVLFNKFFDEVTHKMIQPILSNCHSFVGVNKRVNATLQYHN